MTRLFAAILAVCLGLAGAGCGGCATALLEGVLVADGSGGLAVQANENVVPVDWPDGVGVAKDGDALVLTNLLGLAIAREGEFVSMGGGMVGEGNTFGACGPISVRPSGPPTR